MSSLQLLDSTLARKKNAAPPGPPNLVSMTPEELKAFLVEQGEQAFRAAQIFRWVHKKGVHTFDEMTDLGKPLREKLKEHASLMRLHTQEVQKAADGTRKYRLKTWDGHLIEAVFIPSASAPDKNTLCVSSQVGCAMNCAFCATGAMGLERQDVRTASGRTWMPRARGSFRMRSVRVRCGAC